MIWRSINFRIFLFSLILKFVYSILNESENINVEMAEFHRVNPKFINSWLDEYVMVSGNKAPPRMFIDWIKMAHAYNCSIRPADYQAIFDDLKPFKMPGMSKEYISVAADIISAYGREILPLSPQKLAELSVKMPLHVGNALDLIKTEQLLNPDIDFGLILQYSDESMVIPDDNHSLLPYESIDDVFERNSRFSGAFNEYRWKNSHLCVPHEFNAIPIMLPVFSINRVAGFYDIIMPTRRTGLGMLTREQREAAEIYSNWDLKEGKAVFRGTSSGINFKEAKSRGLDVTVSPRFQLYDLALLQREAKLGCSVQLDFAITKYVQFNANQDDLSSVQEVYPEKPSMGYIDQFRAKYVVLVDGNGWADKVASVMLSGSLLFLSTIHEDWVTRQMTDGIHYIKIKPDLSDLIEKLEWAYANDQASRLIAANGRQLALKKFDTKNMQIYNALLIMEYQNLFL